MEVGNRVFYRDNGKEDTGTVKEIAGSTDQIFYKVIWDNSPDDDLYTPEQLQLIK